MEVSVDQQRSLTLRCQSDSEISADYGLAVSTGRARDQHAFQRATLLRQLQFCREDPEFFSRQFLRFIEGNQSRSGCTGQQEFWGVLKLFRFSTQHRTQQ